MGSVITMTPSSSIFQIATPAMAAPLSNIEAIPSSNVVNERVTFDIFFTTATAGPIKYIALVFHSDISAVKLIERSGIGPGFLATLPDPNPGHHLFLYVVNNPVNVPAGTQIRLEIGMIGNLDKAGDTHIGIATYNSNVDIIDGPDASPDFATKDITGADISPDFMIRKTLKDDSAGNSNGWNPTGINTAFIINDIDLVGSQDSSLISINPFSAGTVVCQAADIDTSLGRFSVNCNAAPANNAQLHYVLFKLPPHVIAPSLSSSTLFTSGSIDRQDETSSEFP